MTFLAEHWLAFVCLLLALALLGAALVQLARRAAWPWGLALPSLLFASYGIGALAFRAWLSDYLPWWTPGVVALVTFAVFVALLIVVILSGFWSAIAGFALTGIFFVGIGALSSRALTETLEVFGTFIASLRPAAPWWLLLLVFVPIMIYTSWRNLISLGETRRWLVLAFRSALIVLIALALAEVHARRPNDHLTVIFVWDRSLSMPPEYQDGVDLREKRIFDFINLSVDNRGSKHLNDKVGVVVFGRGPRLELPPASVTKLGFRKVRSQLDRSYTDIAGAIKFALASFPEDTAKRIVVISDGNENIGISEEQAKIAKQNGVQIDVLPIATQRRHSNEILIEPIETPTVEKDSRLKIRVVVRSFHPQMVAAKLTLRKLTFATPESKDVGGEEHSQIVKLQHGLNVYSFTHTTSKDDTIHAYEASIVPLHVETANGAIVQKGLPGDRIENNQARVAVIGRGERAVLVLEPEKGSHPKLIERLRAMKSSLKVVSLVINERPDLEQNPDAVAINQLRDITRGDPERLATFLSKFDAVIIANLPAEALTEEEQKVFRSAVHDQGMGLIMVGGNQGFGAGGWQNTEVEKALPVNCELKAMKVEGKSGLVLIMHASEMAEGNAWQRKIAQLALEKLSPSDMFGQIHYDHGFNGGKPGHNWHIPFQDIGQNRNRLLKLINSMEPGDMPDVDPAFEKAYKELTNPEYRLGTKHIILISDGDHWDASRQMLDKIKKAKITCTTVCITTHGQDAARKMAAVARATGGRDYFVQDPKELPAIYIKETRLVSQSFTHESPFEPQLVLRDGPTERLDAPLPNLHGFVRTSPKDSPLVRVLIETPALGKDKYKFPILATWQYGLGRSAAFTSDARTRPDKSFWDRDWANAAMHGKFWEQTVDWVLRPSDPGKHLFLTTRFEGGKIFLRLEASDAEKLPITDLDIKAGISSPSFKIKDGKKVDLKFEQKETSGVYVAELPADEIGAYFLNIQAKWKKVEEINGKKVVTEMSDGVRAGVTIPYSPEFAEMSSTPNTLETLRELTGGKTYTDEATALEAAAYASDVFRPVPSAHASLQALWPCFVFLTALCLLFDVALRRIAISPEVLWTKAVALWQKLRGRPSADEPMAEYIERLKTRKAQVDESMQKKAAKKFEAAEGAKSPDAPTVAPVTSEEKPKPAPKPAPAKKTEEADDFATRLMRAKKKAMEERDKDKK